jgi:cytochrome c oxidase cbb3-type subunit III
MNKDHIDEVSGTATTGHDWDGIKELNNPLPRWWVWTFYATIVWALGYSIAYPAWPLINSATTGLIDYSSRKQVASTLDAAAVAQAKQVDAIASKPLVEILGDDALRTFAMAAGSAAFKMNCSQCHGSGAQGASGFPNLNDDDWLWGGDIEAIYQTVAHGIRFSADGKTRFSEMPAFGGVLDPQEISQVTAYVRSLSGSASDGQRAAAGARIYAENCAACHGNKGQGMRELGAPSLADPIWLYGSSEADIAQQVRSPKHGVMPAWNARLNSTMVKQLSIYVHSLGGGQ